MLTFNGTEIAFVPPGPSINEIDDVRDLIDGLWEDGYCDDEIRTFARIMCSESFARYWERTWAPYRHQRYTPETAVAIHNRIVEALLKQLDSSDYRFYL